MNNPSYTDGEDINFYLNNPRLLADVFSNMRDYGCKLSDKECMDELKRLCSSDVRHYYDCKCALHV